ncbi:MAG: hypothetical protein ACI84C_001192 [Flavobacteriales bacterium]|jgi:uncharacterized protein (DUF1800 family)
MDKQKKSGLVVLFLSMAYFSYSQVYDDYIGAGHDGGISVTSSSESSGTNDANTINGFGIDQHLVDASRFLGQSTLGYNYEDIEYCAQLGIENWIDEQMLMPSASYHDSTIMIWDHFLEEYDEMWGISTLEANGVFPYSHYFRMAWWSNTQKGQDQLRQRVALALSEILVISEQSDLNLNSMGLAHYYDVLYENAFGSYEDILMEVTYHPAMGFYLSHLNNEKSDLENNVHPDENYAREIMQLFTIGLFELGPDGTVLLDSDDVPIPTYDNDDIKELAKIFTGFGPAQYWLPFSDLSGIEVVWGAASNTVPSISLEIPMVMFNEWHEPGEKFLLNDLVVPNGQTGDQDVAMAVSNLFNHHNTGPFICTRLIQRLIKSNPTPEYVERMASVFDNNGDGDRGDLGAVVKAILMDDEARDCSWIDFEDSGKMREPLLRYSQLLAAFDASNESGRFWNFGATWQQATGQSVLASPTVFNFFLPDYAPPGPVTDAGLVAPEFQIMTSTSTINYVNTIYYMILADYYTEVTSSSSTAFAGIPGYDADEIDPTDAVTLDFTDEYGLEVDLGGLMRRLDILLCGGTMSDEAKSTIIEVLEQFEGESELTIKTALFLTLVSPDYVIQK